jgi:hypothetical protein
VCVASTPLNDSQIFIAELADSLQLNLKPILLAYSCQTSGKSDLAQKNRPPTALLLNKPKSRC